MHKPLQHNLHNNHNVYQHQCEDVLRVAIMLLCFMPQTLVAQLQRSCNTVDVAENRFVASTEHGK